MSGTLPTVRGPSDVTISSVQPTRTSISHSLKRQARTVNAQRWQMAIVYSPMPRSDFIKYYAFLLSQRGQADTFTVQLGQSVMNIGSWAGAPNVNGASQTGTSVTLRGFNVSTAGVAKAGDFIKFAGHSKVYMVTADASSDALGYATISITPALVVSPPNSDALVTSNVPFTVALTSDNSDMALTGGMMAALTINVAEVF